MTATFTSQDYAKARAILCKRYPMLAGSDSMDEMVQLAALRVWERRGRGLATHRRSGKFRGICKWAGLDVGRDALRLRAPRGKCVDPAMGEPNSDDVPAGPSWSPEDRAVLVEFLDELSTEEREIVEALLNCGGRRDMHDVAEIVGKRAQRVHYVMWRLKRKLREKGRGRILG